jgi:hypothetical protein
VHKHIIKEADKREWDGEDGAERGAVSGPVEDPSAIFHHGRGRDGYTGMEGGWVTAFTVGIAHIPTPGFPG